MRLGCVSLAGLMLQVICQSTVVKRVVEGHSTNVVIVCDLPLLDIRMQYWNISGQVYSRGSVPDVFNISFKDLIIPQVKAAMEGLSLQCFTFGANRNALNLGQTTILSVLSLHGKCFCCL